MLNDAKRTLNGRQTTLNSAKPTLTDANRKAVAKKTQSLTHVSKNHPNFLLSWLQDISRAKKESQNQKIARTAPKNFLNNSMALPNKTSVLRQIAPESPPESWAKSLSQKLFGVAFLSLNVSRFWPL